jgi:hypothetical protein
MSSRAALRPSIVLWALLAACAGGTTAAAHSLGDLVFCDLNGDGVFEPATESGIAGVTVVRDCGGLIATTVTNASGRYVFSRVPAGPCRVYVDGSSTPIAGMALSTPRVAGPPPPTAEHSPAGGFGCGTCPNAFVTTVVTDGVFQNTLNNPCNCVDPACVPSGPDPCAGATPFVGYYGDDFGFLCVPPTTTSSTTTSTTTSTTAITTTSTTTTTICPPFPFLSRTEGKIGNDGRVNGSIGTNDAGGNFHFGKRVVQTNGSTVAADDLGLGEGTSVFDALGNVLRMGPGVVIRGSTGTPTLPLASPFCPIPDFACGSPDVTVPLAGSVGPLAPGAYGRLSIFRQGTLTLAPGTFTFCSLKTAVGATIAITGPELTTINVVGTFRLSDASTLAPLAGSPIPVLNVAGPFMRVGSGSTLVSYLSAPDATLTLGRSSTVGGTFCAGTSRSDKHVHLSCPPASPSGAFVDTATALR